MSAIVELSDKIDDIRRIARLQLTDEDHAELEYLAFSKDHP